MRKTILFKINAFKVMSFFIGTPCILHFTQMLCKTQVLTVFFLVKHLKCFIQDCNTNLPMWNMRSMKFFCYRIVVESSQVIGSGVAQGFSPHPQTRNDFLWQGPGPAGQSCWHESNLQVGCSFQTLKKKVQNIAWRTKQNHENNSHYWWFQCWN